MRLRKTCTGLTINVVAGTSAVLFSLDMDEDATKGLLGFYIHKKNLRKGTEYDIKSIKYFAETIPSPQHGATYSTKEHPWQSFFWEDFYVEYKGEYEYTFTPVRGNPTNLIYDDPVTVRISIPSPKDDVHEVYFNLGVAGSQAYAREFKNMRPDQMEPTQQAKALKWLSKGLKEALIKFIEQAKDNNYALRCAFYEFKYPEVLQALKAAHERGVDVKIVYDSRKEKESNDAAIKAVKVPRKILIRRETDPQFIAHNKFMVLLKSGQPKQVWTGSTNITDKGIFGQCNTGHIVRDEKVAANYLAYWNCLKDDPDYANTRLGCLKIQNDITEFENGVFTFFSPRARKKLLDVYSTVINQSQQLVCGMFPFSFNKTIKDAISANTDHLKYVIIDKKDANTTLTSNDVDNVVIYGNVLDTPIYQGLDETQAGKLFRNGTNYIHNKVILIDPLSETPIVISGSANFYDNSILGNDENTLVIKGNKKVADLYFTEFSRIFNHYSSRSDIHKLTKRNQEGNININHLYTDSQKWVPSFFRPNALKAKRKKIFDEMTIDEVIA